MIILELLFTFMKIGAFTFGGGYAMLPLIESEVIRHGWLTEKELINFIAVSESTPGPFAINISTYVGMETAGIAGAAAATLGVVFPSFVIILIVARIYDAFRRNRIVSGCMSGLKPAVIGLIGSAMLSVGSTVFFNGRFTLSAFTHMSLWVSLAIFALMIFLSIKKLHPIIIIALSALIGIVLGYAGVIKV